MKLCQIRKKALIILPFIISLSVFFAACGAGQESGGTDSADKGGVSGTVTVSGSTSVQPLAQDLADAFNEINPDVSIEIQGGGSSQGIKDVADGISDIGNSSRELKEEEKSLGLTEHIIAYDGIAVIVNPANTVENLSKEQVQKIFKGEITNWKDVGGKDQEILVVTREDGSGTKSAFEEMLKLQEEKDGMMVSLIRSDALVADGNGPVKANIASKENAIGYISLGFADNTVKKLRVDGIECTSENIKNKTYTIARPFLMLTRGDLKPAVKAYIDFIMSDKGQEIVGKTYITVK